MKPNRAVSHRREIAGANHRVKSTLANANVVQRRSVAGRHFGNLMLEGALNYRRTASVHLPIVVIDLKASFFREQLTAKSSVCQKARVLLSDLNRAFLDRSEQLIIVDGAETGERGCFSDAK